MRHVTTLCLTALLIAGVSVAGCGSKKAKTPKDAVLNFVKAVEKNDKGLFMASIDCPDKEFAELTFDGMQAMLKFMKKFEKEYGAGAMKKDGGHMDKPPTVAEVEKKLKIEEKDGETVGIIDKETFPLVQKDGCWKLDVSKEMPSDPKQLQAQKDLARKMVKAAGEAEKKVGQAKYKDNPQQIFMEMVMEGIAGS